MNRLHTSSQEDQRHQESKLRSMAIVDDNFRTVTSRRDAKAHEKQDDIIRNDYATQLHEQDVVNEKHHEQEKFDRAAEYGESLRKQIADNERRRQAIKSEDLADDKKRNDSSKKHLDDCVEFNENAHERSDRSQHQRESVSARWTTENDFNIAKQGKPTGMYADDGNFEDEDSKSMNVAEVQHRIAARKAILEQLQDRIEVSYRKYEEEKRTRAQVLLEIQREEYKLKQLHEKEQRNHSEHSNDVERIVEHMSRATVEENNSSHSKFY